MIKIKWDLFNLFKNKGDDSITLFPEADEVFVNPEIKIYFTPLLTYIYKVKNRGYKIHMLTSAGLICENNYLNSENRFFGFKYVNGKYEFLGDIDTFGSSNIKDVYNFLWEDFKRNRDYYLDKKVPLNDYIKIVKPLASEICHFTEEQSLELYIENFYSYELEKYNYQKNKKLRHLFEITESVKYNKNPYFFNKDETEKILENFYKNMSNYFKNRYDFQNTKPICAIDTYRFSNFPSLSVTFFDPEKNNIYVLEYDKK